MGDNETPHDIFRSITLCSSSFGGVLCKAVFLRGCTAETSLRLSWASGFADSAGYRGGVVRTFLA